MWVVVLVMAVVVALVAQPPDTGLFIIAPPPHARHHAPPPALPAGCVGVQNVAIARPSSRSAPPPPPPPLPPRPTRCVCVQLVMSAEEWTDARDEHEKVCVKRKVRRYNYSCIAIAS